MTSTELNNIRNGVLAMPSLFANAATLSSDISPVPKTDSGNVAFDTGYPADYDNAGATPKTIERNKMNWLLRVLSQGSFFGQTGIRYTYNSDVATAIGGYPLGAVLAYDDGTSIRNVVSLVDDNTHNFLTDGVDNQHWKYLDSASSGIFLDYGSSTYLFTADIPSGTSSVTRCSGWVEMPHDGWIYPQFNIYDNVTTYLVIGPADGSVPEVTLTGNEYTDMVPDEQNTKNYTAFLLGNNTYQNKYILPVRKGTKMAVYGKNTGTSVSGNTGISAGVFVRLYGTI
jgi:hypothetical protein